MKRNFFNPGRLDKNRLPKIVSRRIFGSSPNNFAAGTAYRSDGGDDDEDDDDASNETKRLLKKVNIAIRKATEGLGKDDVLAVRSIIEEVIGKKGKDGKFEEGSLNIEALRSLTDEKAGVIQMIAKQGQEITDLKNRVNDGGKDMSIRAQCIRWMESNKDAIAKYKDGTSKSMPELQIDLRFAGDILQTRDANSPMTPANTMPNGTTYITRFEVDPTVNNPLRPNPTLWDALSKGRTGSETYAWVNKKPTEGAAAFIAPGVYKPAVSFTIESEFSRAKKIAANEKMAMELLDDIDGFVSWVETELRYQLDIKLNEAVSTGVSSSTAISGLTTLSQPFPEMSGCEAEKANIWDAISACVDVLRARFLSGPIVCRIHPIDLGNAKRTKANNQGQLFVAPVTGATILEDYTQTRGTITVFAVNYYKLLIYKAFMMKWGWENDDFTKNLVTVIGELRLHQFVSDQYINEFAITDTLDNIIAAINVAPQP
jgi:hypothetical protein